MFAINDETERRCLAGMLRQNSCIDDILRVLRAEDFRHAVHGDLFRVIVELWTSGRAVDGASLADELHRRGKLKDIGGPAAIGDVLEADPTGALALHHAEVIRRRSIFRQLACAAGQITALTALGDGDAQDVLDQSNRLIAAVAERGATHGPVPLAQLLDESLADLDRRISEGNPPGLPTGLQRLDQILGGLRPGELTVVAALTSVGKSSFALQVAMSATARGQSVFVASLEMSAAEVTNRVLCAAARVELARYRNGICLDQDEITRLADAACRIRPWLMSVDGTASQSMLDIGASARQLQRRQGLGLVIVDYLQLVAPENSKAGRTEQVDDISRRLKVLAKDLKVPVIALAQLSRAAIGAEKPLLSHLRESGRIEQDADVVILLSKVNDGNTVSLDVAKQRNGPTEAINVVFHKEFALFEDRGGSPFST